ATVTLSRATYKLPKDKAEALSAFLREHVKASVVETKVEGENFIVTTTPEAQHVIGQFVALIEGKPLGAQHATSIYTTAPAQAKYRSTSPARTQRHTPGEGNPCLPRALFVFRCARRSDSTAGGARFAGVLSARAVTGCCCLFPHSRLLMRSHSVL